uniref:Poly(A) polymerase catalytic subunit domain-containing protein n=1 Tax=viral metagenome TaxID=1070528 RepID=A0A6C0JA73_9ZZZZ
MSTIIDYINKQTITNVIEKAIPEDKLLQFHNLIDTFLKNNDDIIVKGGRALHQSVPIYDSKELLYKDYDLYSKNPKESLIEIGKELVKNDIIEFTIENIIFKPHIFRLKLFTIPFIDVEPLSCSVPQLFLNEINVVHPKYQRIDIYIQLSRPTLINLDNWTKIIPRLEKINEKYPFRCFHKNQIGKLHQNINKILPIIEEDCVISGEIALYHHMKEYKNNCYLPDINHLVLFTHNTTKYIKLIKYIFKNCEIKEEKDKMNHCTTLYKIYNNDTLLVDLYYLDDCINYDDDESYKYSSVNHLFFYYHMLPYTKENETVLFHLHNTYGTYVNNLKCHGYRNPGVKELKTTFINREQLCKINHLML